MESQEENLSSNGRSFFQNSKIRISKDLFTSVAFSNNLKSITSILKSNFSSFKYFRLIKRFKEEKIFEIKIFFENKDDSELFNSKPFLFNNNHWISHKFYDEKVQNHLKQQTSHKKLIKVKFLKSRTNIQVNEDFGKLIDTSFTKIIEDDKNYFLYFSKTPITLLLESTNYFCSDSNPVISALWFWTWNIECKRCTSYGHDDTLCPFTNEEEARIFSTDLNDYGKYYDQKKLKPKIIKKKKKNEINNTKKSSSSSSEEKEQPPSSQEKEQPKEKEQSSSYYSSSSDDMNQPMKNTENPTGSNTYNKKNIINFVDTLSLHPSTPLFDINKRRTRRTNSNSKIGKDTPKKRSYSQVNISPNSTPLPKKFLFQPFENNKQITSTLIKLNDSKNMKQNYEKLTPKSSDQQRKSLSPIANFVSFLKDQYPIPIPKSLSPILKKNNKSSNTSSSSFSNKQSEATELLTEAIEFKKKNESNPSIEMMDEKKK